ncbi:polysaccharide biosynthesis tyrosine autokinase [Siccirubricoccus sp. KC 17139]|uniref:non-specific protein-tyrosine kinase n=1 Tax=Siccirubricoccus soli TaxID=2899147 RepID=A0ABT1D8Z1_9PROT|nr:polysaccharide biosynthesis tyrosine autokinase [Siccirubricoccus soli]MCO6418403.1 polysaccharide biosynthesis tyrosine autokinase [Siccirubricoccus soli]MCP2684538.1 polysaccharide biosynthesis tyrosine autokinase [Siccirubricoccus soli]
MIPDPLTRPALPAAAAPMHAPAPYAAELRQEGGFTTAFAALRRSRLLLLAWVLVTFGLAAAAILQLSPRYRASALVLLDMRELNLGDVRGPLIGPTASLDSTIVRSQVELLGSEELARRVVADLGLVDNPEFRPRVSRKEMLLNHGLDLLRRAEDALRLPAEWRLLPPAPPPTPTSLAERTAYAVDLYRNNLSVFNDGRSFAITVGFQSADPELAARIANRHVALYVEEQRRAKREALSVAGTWLTEEVEEQAGRLREAERALQEYRERNNLFAPRGVSIVAQELSEVNNQLAAARADLAAKEARLRSAQTARLQSGGGDSELAVISSDTISRLREAEATARRRASEAASRLGSRHPEVLATRAEVAEVQSKIAEEVQKIMRVQASEAAIARVRVQELQRSVAQLEQRMAENERAETGARDLERVATATRTLYENLLVRQKQFAAQEGIQRADARMISPAGVPLRPSFPNVPLFLAAAFLASAGSGVGVALLRERLRSRITSLEEAAELVGAPALGTLPRSPLRSPMHRRVVERPKSAIAEAMRTLRSALALQQRNLEILAPGARTLALTSALPGEGKTTIALSMARSMAVSGLSVLLIDADLRKPKVARLIWGRPPSEPGLAAAIEHELPLDAVVLTDHATPLKVIHASDRAPIAPPQDVLAAPGMRRLLNEARQAFDYVIIDTPPAALVTDAAVVGGQVEGVMLISRWNRTPVAALRAAARNLATAQVKLLGVVLNDADPNRLPEYGSGATYAIGTRNRYFEA